MGSHSTPYILSWNPCGIRTVNTQYSSSDQQASKYASRRPLGGGWVLGSSRAASRGLSRPAGPTPTRRATSLLAASEGGVFSNRGTHSSHHDPRHWLMDTRAVGGGLGMEWWLPCSIAQDFSASGAHTCRERRSSSGGSLLTDPQTQTRLGARSGMTSPPSLQRPPEIEWELPCSVGFLDQRQPHLPPST